MKNKIIALIVLLILAFAGGYYYMNTNMKVETPVTTPEQALMEVENTVPATPEEEILQTEQVEASIDAEVDELENTTF